MTEQLIFYSDDVRQKTIHLVHHCVQVLGNLGDINAMTERHINYVIVSEASKSLLLDNELMFVTGLATKIISEAIKLANTKPQIQLPDEHVKIPVITRSPNPVVCALMGSRRTEEQILQQSSFPALQIPENTASENLSAPPGFEHVKIPDKNVSTKSPGFSHIKILKRPDGYFHRDLLKAPEDVQIQLAEESLNQFIEVSEIDEKPVDTPLDICVPESDTQTNKKSYCQIAMSGVELPELVVAPKKSTPVRRNSHFFQYVREESGLIDPILVDRRMTNDCDTCFFISEKVTEEELAKYLMKNYPRTEYYTTYTQMDDEQKFRVRITFNGLSAPEKIDSMISAKLAERDFVDIFTTYSEEIFMQNIAEYSDKYFTTSRYLDERILSIRFFKNIKNVYIEPTDKNLEEQFRNNCKGKVPVAFVHNMPLEKFLALTENRILGHKFILTKNQPEDVNLRSIMVFKNSVKKL